MDKAKIYLYNTLARRKELFRPIRKDRVGLYTCGPTVYNFAHIGNFRTYIFQDVLKRTLERAGLRIQHIMNITDVDDKTIAGAKKAGTSLRGFTRRYESIFKEDLKKLNIKPPSKFVRATEHVGAMLGLIAQLLKRGLAYEKNGSVYFSIAKFKKYGKLARLDQKGLKAGARVDADEYDKDKVQDFVLWKHAKSAPSPAASAMRMRPCEYKEFDGEPAWWSPWGWGRPGWHIECSAMSMKYLGTTIDIHTGGVDLIFPHHENEIAQSEGASGKKFVNCWIHGEHILVNSRKMSKSLGNFYTLRDVEAKGVNPLALRYLVLTSHYRSKLNFTWKSLSAAQSSLNRLQDFVRSLQPPHYRGSASIVKLKTLFKKAIFNDLDTPRALAVLWQLVRDYNKNPAAFNSREVLSILYDFDRVLGLGLRKIKKEKIPADILALVKKREEHRKKKEWSEADKVRQQVKERGYLIDDTPSGPKIKNFG